MSTKNLTDAQRRFILHWGEMATRWGISRAVAQIHALLLVSETPLNAQDISELLGVSRSNVSTGIRELQSWSLVRTTHILGDRRDNFEAMKEPWQLFRAIADKRIERELIPTLKFLSELSEAKPGLPVGSQKFVKDLSELIEFGVTFYQKTSNFPIDVLLKLLKVPPAILKMLEPKRARPTKEEA